MQEEGKTYHYGSAVGEIRLDAEDVVVSDLDATALRIIQMQILNLNRRIHTFIYESYIYLWIKLGMHIV